MCVDLLRNVSDVGASHLEFYPSENRPFDQPLRQSSDYQGRDCASQLQMPLQIFGEKSLWLPYISLQQIDILCSPETAFYIVGTTNSIFTQQKGCAPDLIVHCEDGMIEVTSTVVNNQIGLTAADKKFMDDLIKSVMISEKGKGKDFLMKCAGKFYFHRRSRYEQPAELHRKRRGYPQSV